MSLTIIYKDNYPSHVTIDGDELTNLMMVMDILKSYSSKIEGFEFDNFFGDVEYGLGAGAYNKIMGE